MTSSDSEAVLEIPSEFDGCEEASEKRRLGRTLRCSKFQVQLDAEGDDVDSQVTLLPGNRWKLDEASFTETAGEKKQKYDEKKHRNESFYHTLVQHILRCTPCIYFPNAQRLSAAVVCRFRQWPSELLVLTALTLHAERL